MKTLYKIVSAFVVIGLTAFCTDLAFGKIAKSVFGKKINSKQEYLMTQKDDSEILILGSSRAQHHYDTPYITDSLNIKALNAGQDGRGLTFQLPLLQSYLKHNKPKLIILDLLPQMDGSWNERVTMLYPLIDKSPEVLDVAERIDSNNRFYLKSQLYRYNSNLVNEAKSYLHPFNLNASRGYDPLPIISNQSKQIKEGNFTYHSPTDSLERQILIDIISLCKQKRVNLVGVMSPLYGNVDRVYEIDSIFSRYDIPFIDNLSYRLPLQPEQYFTDSHHLNAKGAREYTKFVMQQVYNNINIKQ